MCSRFLQQSPDTFRNAYQTKPDHTVTFVRTLPGTATQAECNVVLKQGVEHMQLLMLYAAAYAEHSFSMRPQRRNSKQSS